MADVSGRCRPCNAVFEHAFKMEFDGVTNFSLNFRNGGACGDASWKIGNIGGVIAFSLSQ
jgi:hypothetical protein